VSAGDADSRSRDQQANFCGGEWMTRIGCCHDDLCYHPFFNNKQALKENSKLD